MTDAIVESVRSKLRSRAEVGQRKYGVTMERTDLTHRQWLVHAQEEAMDLAVYLEKLIQAETVTPAFTTEPQHGTMQERTTP
jgi:hypothetical protein